VKESIPIRQLAQNFDILKTLILLVFSRMPPQARKPLERGGETHRQQINCNRRL
jgi:hypothetical protein